jgi:hypothetical protein
MPDDLTTGGAASATPAGGAAPAAAAADVAPAAAPVITAPAAPVEAAVPAAPAGDVAAAPGAVDAPAAKPAEPAAAPAEKAKPEFAPSLLDEAAKPTAEAKPSDKPAEAKPGETKDDAAKPPADKAPAADPAPPAPIEYAFKYPEGFNAENLDQERMGAFTGVLSEARVPPEAAQKMLDLHVGEINRVTDAITTRQWDVFNTTQNDWRKATMSDPEIGGPRHDTAIKTIMGLVDLYGDRFQGTRQARDAAAIAAERKELLDVFRMTGAANHPRILGLLHFAGEKMREGTARPAPPPRGNPNPGGNRGLNRYRGSTPAR